MAKKLIPHVGVAEGAEVDLVHCAMHALESNISLFK
jgi:hypothetical protein